MPMADVLTFQVDDAQIIFRNFSGKEDKYNREGDRNFSVILDEETAEHMLADGWNVKYLAAREEGDAETPYIQVAVGYKNRPPRIVLIYSSGRTNLDEGSVETLDWVSIRKADLIARAYQWEVNGKGGIKAYLQTMFVTIEEDELERRYAVKAD